MTLFTRPLEVAYANFARVVLPADMKKYGGELYGAAGTRGAV